MWKEVYKKEIHIFPYTVLSTYKTSSGWEKLKLFEKGKEKD